MPDLKIRLRLDLAVFNEINSRSLDMIEISFSQARRQEVLGLCVVSWCQKRYRLLLFCQTVHGFHRQGYFQVRYSCKSSSHYIWSPAVGRRKVLSSTTLKGLARNCAQRLQLFFIGKNIVTSPYLVRDGL